MVRPACPLPPTGCAAAAAAHTSSMAAALHSIPHSRCRWQRLRWRPTSHEEGVYYERKLLDILRNTYEAQDVRVSG